MLTIIACVAACAQQASAASRAKVSLIFSMDQGFGNGVVANGDQVAVKRVVAALKPLEKRYSVYVLVNPQVADRKKLVHVLDTLVAEKMPFVFDVYSSDSFTLGSTTKQNKPFDATHGVSISMDDLAAYKKRYGKWLAGIRFMEVFGEDFTVRMVKTQNVDWLPKACKLPEDEFFQPKIVERYLEFAKRNGMFAQWSDSHWSEFAEWDQPQKDNETRLAQVLRKFPGVVTVTYANNEPEEGSAQRFGFWERSVSKFTKDGAAGFGLSDQYWNRKATPEDGIVPWAKSALDKGCRLIQFEPAWHFFALPVGTFEVIDYTTDPKWADRGEPTESFRILVEALMK